MYFIERIDKDVPKQVTPSITARLITSERLAEPLKVQLQAKYFKTQIALLTSS